MRSNKLVYIFISIAIILSLIAIIQEDNNQTEQETTFEKVMKEHEMTVCYIPWPPSTIKDPDTGDLSGFMIDIIDEFAKDANLKLDYVQSTWAGFPADLNTGRCDAAISGFYPTIGRSTGVAFTKPFFYGGNSAVIAKDDERLGEIEFIQDLNREDITIAVIQGDFDHIYAKKYLPNAKLLVLDKSSDIIMSLVAVSSGKADVGLSTSDTVGPYTEEHPELKALFLAEPYSIKPITWAVRHEDQELLNFLNNGLEYLEATGYLAQTINRYKPDGWYSLDQRYVEHS